MVNIGQNKTERGESPATADGVMRLARDSTDCPPPRTCVHGTIPGPLLTGDRPVNQESKKSGAFGTHPPHVWNSFTLRRHDLCPTNP